MERIDVRCCIAGGGPAGMVLGVLLARAGIDVVVLEKHADFFRDFRGDTIHPSTLDVMYELGLLDKFLRLPHQEVRQLDVQIADVRLTIADFTHLPTHCKFLALMPQWDFLNFMRAQGSRYPTFRLEMETTAEDLILEDGRVAGVRAKGPRGEIEIHAALTVGADGRSSTVREKAGLEVINRGAPIDVLWMRVSRQESDPAQTFGRIDTGHMMVMLNRGEYWQCAYVIPKGGFEAIRSRGLEAFRETLVGLAPYLRDRIGELRDWDDIKLLTVTIDRLKHWSRDGLVCIGDAAHAMSPVGGVGINLAVQDAVAAANMLAADLHAGTPPVERLRALQERREPPMKIIQSIQVMVQNRVIGRVLAGTKPMSAPWPLRLFASWPFLRRFPALAVGVGFRPEHVKTLEARPPGKERSTRTNR